MGDDRTHPLLAQVPLAVSPFVALPTAATLPYTYKSMPSTLPPASTGVSVSTSTGPATPTPTAGASENGSSAIGGNGIGMGGGKPKYVVSSSGHAAHPDDIVASCRALQAHVARLQDDADRELRRLDERIRARELAEKRRLAPGWLDSDARLLQPERKDSGQGGSHGDDYGGGGSGFGGDASNADVAQLAGRISEMAVDEAEQLDRAFGRHA
ncbi:hypothetical protein F4777DRAFT_537609 [Nemania sp. FL0916]|nr:hypothetical protein F4777DRAFT_537609 [Nemania sp. FL0916]